MKTVLIVDADLGFVFWLGEALHAAGYAAFPARSVPLARTSLAEWQLAVDILIVDPSLPGASNFVRALRQDREDMRVVAVSEGDESGPLFRADVACEKPAGTSREALSEWNAMMRGMLLNLGPGCGCARTAQ